MSNLVLYRKYRPQTFAEIIGQEHVVKTLTNAISAEMISHAYLFSGPRGSGKTTIARVFAKAVNCRNRQKGQFEPCDKCASCMEIKKNQSLDLIEIDAASHRGIDEIRELRDGIKFAPVKEKYKVFIIDESHQLTKEAANALLKTLEEPPPHAIFVLATTEIYKMIPTIISRCQRFDFRKLTVEEIIKRLEIISQKEKVKIERAALELIALKATGSIRDGEALLDQTFTFAGALFQDNTIKAEDIKKILGLPDIALINSFIDKLLEKNRSGAIVFLEELFEKGYDPYEFVGALINYLHQVMLLRVGSSSINPLIVGLNEEEKKIIRAQAEKFNYEQIQKALNLFLEAEKKMKYSSIPELPLELATVDFIGE